MNVRFGKKRSRFRFFFLLSIIPFAGLGLFLFLNIGTLLTVEDPVPARLDVIFTFAGENQRVFYSRKLSERFPGAHWVLSDYFHMFSHILERDGFPMARVSILDTSTNTLSEVNGLKDWVRTHRDSLCAAKKTAMNNPGPLRIGLVSNPLHMRRIKFMAQSVFSDTSIRIFYLPVPLEEYSWTSADIRYWWQSKTVRNWVSSEIEKLFAFWFFS